MKKGNNFMLDLITIKGLAEKINKPESTIRTWKRTGQIPKECFFKIGRTVFVREDKFNEWVETSA